MIKTNLPVLFIKNHEIFPYCETKLEFSDINLKKTISLAESYFDNCVFIIHQKADDNLENLYFDSNNEIEKIIRIIAIDNKDKFNKKELKLGVITIDLTNVITVGAHAFNGCSGLTAFNSSSAFC